MEYLRAFSVFVSSPGDVEAEREQVTAVIAELNSGLAKDRGIFLQELKWERDARPGFHPSGAQGRINRELKPHECDLFIGIMWKRFGTPVEDAGSGTESEFRMAYESWKKTHRRPQIKFYFITEDWPTDSSQADEQLKMVIEFKESLFKEGLPRSVRNRTQFERTIRGDLEDFLLNPCIASRELFRDRVKKIPHNARTFRGDFTRSKVLRLCDELTDLAFDALEDLCHYAEEVRDVHKIRKRDALRVLEGKWGRASSERTPYEAARALEDLVLGGFLAPTAISASRSTTTDGDCTYELTGLFHDYTQLIRNVGSDKLGFIDFVNPPSYYLSSEGGAFAPDNPWDKEWLAEKARRLKESDLKKTEPVPPFDHPPIF